MWSAKDWACAVQRMGMCSAKDWACVVQKSLACIVQTLACMEQGGKARQVHVHEEDVEGVWQL